ncbi:hypothetical protein WAI92_21825, partial [Acinetobacter baumannii]
LAVNQKHGMHVQRFANTVFELICQANNLLEQFVVAFVVSNSLDSVLEVAQVVLRMKDVVKINQVVIDQTGSRWL